VTGRDLVDLIVVYTLAMGIIPETLKYLVIRYVAWKDQFRDRYDAIAYGAASAIGYAVILNLWYVFEATPSPDIAAVRIAGVTLYGLFNSTIVAYGVGAIRLQRPSPLLVPGLISVASLATGLLYTLRINLANTRLTLSVSFPRLLISFLLAVMLTGAIFSAMIFLFNTVERETTTRQDDVL
ncbi:MAG: PrsW family glutamic-type intramembrane protease, partial [Chloroflexota bacterium]